MATRRQRMVLFSAGLLVANVIYLLFVPGEGWKSFLLPELNGWLVYYAIPLLGALVITVIVNLTNRADRLWWLMSLGVAVIVPFLAYRLYLLLAFGTCVIDRCGY